MVNAQKVKDMVTRRSSQLAGSLSGNKVPPHKHCRICHEAIPVSSEERVCKKSDCIDQFAKDEKNQRTVRIAMFVFFGLFALPYVIALAARLVA